MCFSPKFSDFQVDCLDAHNDYRSRHGVPRMDLNANLCKYAEDHAKYLCQCDTEKASKGPYGESIYIKTSSRKIYPDAYAPVIKWYSESKHMDEEDMYPNEKTKHYSQIIWKATRSLGIGYALNSKKNKIFVVANYYPPGNDYDSFCDNVKPIRKPGNDCPSKIRVI